MPVTWWSSELVRFLQPFYLRKEKKMREITFNKTETRFYITTENGEPDHGFGVAVVAREATDTEVGRWVRYGELPKGAVRRTLDDL